MNEQDHSFQDKLLRKLDAQTEALHRLISVMEAMTLAMADEADDYSEEAPASMYLNGMPR